MGETEGLWTAEVAWYDGEYVFRGSITKEMIDRAAAAYEFGVMPGDESEATDEEIRTMAERVLKAALER